VSERPDELKDDLLGTRLESSLGATPSWLTSRLEHLAAAGLRSGRPEPGTSQPWLAFVPQQAAAVLLLALLAGAMSQLLALFKNPPSASPGAWTSLMLPIGVLLCVEAMRGAPTVRRWLH
jgi:hypothetical protein